MNSQRKYQERMKREGLCTTCGKEKIYKWSSCLKHYLKKKKYQVKYQKQHKEEQRKRCEKFRRDNPEYHKEYYRKNKSLSS